MVSHFLVSICDEYFQFGASLDKIHKINRCRAVSVMRSDAEFLSWSQDDTGCTGGMQHCSAQPAVRAGECSTAAPANLDHWTGGVLQMCGARCQSDGDYAETGKGNKVS